MYFTALADCRKYLHRYTHSFLAACASSGRSTNKLCIICRHLELKEKQCLNAHFQNKTQCIYMACIFKSIQSATYTGTNTSTTQPVSSRLSTFWLMCWAKVWNIFTSKSHLKIFHTFAQHSRLNLRLEIKTSTYEAWCVIYGMKRCALVIRWKRQHWASARCGFLVNRQFATMALA